MTSRDPDEWTKEMMTSTDPKKWTKDMMTRTDPERTDEGYDDKPIDF